MAMSDWDCLAYGTDGKCCGGTFSVLGIEGGLSKRRLWAKPDGQEGPVFDIRDGEAGFGGLSVVAFVPTTPAARSMDATFFRVSGWDGEVVRDPTHKAGYDVTGGPVNWAAIGCSSYDDPIPRMLAYLELDGVLDPDDCSLTWEFGGWFDEDDNEFGMVYVEPDFEKHPCLRLWAEMDFRIEIDEAKEEGLDSQYLGVTPELLAEFHAWLVGSVTYGEGLDGDGYVNAADRAWLETVLAAEPLRFNQGDGFFVGPDASMTVVGAAHEETMCSGIIRDLADEGRLPNILEGE